MHAIVIGVSVRHPDGTRMRRASPMTMCPYPMTTPDPGSLNPNVIRTGGGNCDRFHNQGWRRSIDDDFLSCRGRRWCLPVNHLLTGHTTTHQQSTGGD